MDDIKLQQLGQFTPEGVLNPGYGNHYIFFVGRDNVHGILLHLLGQEKFGFDFNMYGFADDEINQAILKLLETPSVSVQGTLDKSQAGGVHEKQLLALDMKTDPSFNNSIVIGESQTKQISHTKGGIFVGQGIAFEGSTNWSTAGEGIGISLKPGNQPSGFKAQNNTLVVSTSPIFISRFQRQLLQEHRIAQQQK